MYEYTEGSTQARAGISYQDELKLVGGPIREISRVDAGLSAMYENIRTLEDALSNLSNRLRPVLNLSEILDSSENKKDVESPMPNSISSRIEDQSMRVQRMAQATNKLIDRLEI